jgi:hypothetical protein
LAQVEAQHKKITRRSHARAGMSVALGFTGCVAQLVGLGSGIYIFYDWNAVEPYTWMFCKFHFHNLVAF